jgi:hypothetical protein
VVLKKSLKIEESTKKGLDLYSTRDQSEISFNTIDVINKFKKVPKKIKAPQEEGFFEKKVLLTKKLNRYETFINYLIENSNNNRIPTVKNIMKNCKFNNKLVFTEKIIKNHKLEAIELGDLKKEEVSNRLVLLKKEKY